jgi:hypothetical protein
MDDLQIILKECNGFRQSLDSLMSVKHLFITCTLNKSLLSLRCQKCSLMFVTKA